VFAGHGKFGGTPAEDALTRLKTLVYGGTPLIAITVGHVHHEDLANVRQPRRRRRSPDHARGIKLAMPRRIGEQLKDPIRRDLPVTGPTRSGCRQDRSPIRSKAV
jgi:hypothetical protein